MLGVWREVYGVLEGEEVAAGAACDIGCLLDYVYYWGFCIKWECGRE